MDSVSTPLVSIAVITYNSSKYVLETLESAKAQTYQNIELIISDDCSTDNTVQICKDWVEQNKQRFARVQIVESEKNTGVSANCNRAEGACQGEWVKLIAGDDILLPNCIEDYVSYVLAVEDCLCVFSKVKVFSDSQEKIEHFIKYGYNYDFFNWSREKQIESFENMECCIPMSTIFYNINKLKKNGVATYDERIPMIEDRTRCLTMLRKKLNLDFLNKELVMYRVGHEESLSTSSRKSVFCYESLRLYFFYYLYDNLLLKDRESAIRNVVDYETSQYKLLCDVQDNYYSILNSKAFRLGCIILKPMYILKNLINRIEKKKYAEADNRK